MTDDGSDLSFGGTGVWIDGLPPTIDVEVPDRGTARVRDLAGPPGAPTVILLHGWTATADLNFFTCFEALRQRFRVVSFDHHGHAYGIRNKSTFRLEDAADDVAAIADQLGVDRFIPFGYSMGGAIAQLMWKQHRDRIDGLLLGSTAPYFAGRREERLSFMGLTGLAAVARITPSQARDWITDQFYLQRKEASWGPEAMEQVSLHDWRSILEAGKAIGDFSSTDWIGDIDVPTSIIITMHDPVVPTRRQVKLWELIGHADVFRIDGAHDAIVAQADRYVPQLMRALDSITEAAYA